MKKLLLASTTVLLSFSLSFSATAENLVDLDSPEFGEAVRAYIMENPAILFEAAEKYQTEQANLASEEAKTMLAELEPKLLEAKNGIVLGNPDAPIAFVEFIDYACGYCRKAHTAINDILAKNDDVKVVVRQFPILSQGSLEAARVALAILNVSGNENAIKFHDAAYEASSQVGFEAALDIAASLGLDRSAIEEASKSPDIMAEISLIGQAARDLNLSGTPAFILNGQIFPGYIPEEDMQKIIDDARAKL